MVLASPQQVFTCLTICVYSMLLADQSGRSLSILWSVILGWVAKNNWSFLPTITTHILNLVTYYMRYNRRPERESGNNDSDLKI